MIHYTPLHQQEIFPIDQEVYQNQVMIKQGNSVYYFERLNEQDYRVAQIISTNPYDYMQHDHIDML